MSSDLAAKRRAIRAECTRQGIDDATRRAMMLEHAGVSSSCDLTVDGARKVLRHLHKTGGDHRPGREGAPKTLDRVPQLQKIEALLADMQAPWSYAEKIAERITGGKAGGVKRLEWVRDSRHLRGIIVALAIEKKKRVDKAMDELRAQLDARGLDMWWLAEEAKKLNHSPAWPWHDCLESLRQLAARLP